MLDDQEATGDTGQASDPVVRVNNREVPLSQAQEVLNEMAASLRSGYDRKLAEERAATRVALEQDKEFYATHDPSEWAHYEPKVDGGRGYIGTGQPKPANNTPNQPTAQVQQQQNVQQATNPFAENDVLSVKKDIDSLREQLAQRETQEAIAARDALIAKYPDADIVAVTARMKDYHLEHGRPASKAEIETYLRDSHTHVTKRVESARKIFDVAKQTGTNSATPDVRGATPDTGTAKAARPRLDDIDAWGSFIAEKQGGA